MLAITAYGTLLVFAGLRAADLLHRRNEEFREAERAASGLTIVLGGYLRETIGALDASLRQLALQSARMGGAGASADEWMPLLRSARAGLTGIGSISVVDRDGIIRHTTQPLILGQSRADEYVFRRLASENTETLVAGTPFRTISTPTQLLIPFARRVNAASGEFAGIIVAMFNPEQLRPVFRTVGVGRHGIVWVFHPAGVVLFREPSSVNPIGEPAAGNPVFEAARRGARDGVVRRALVPGGARFLSVYHAVTEPPLTVAVSQSEWEILAAWRWELLTSAAIALLLAMSLAVFLAVLFRQIDTRFAAEEALLRSQRLESLGQLTGGVAHDFNNLLTVILGNASMLKRRSPAGLASGAAEELTQIERAATRAAELTSRLLAFARRQPLQPRLTDLNTLSRGLEPMLSRVVGADVTIRFDLHPDPCLAMVDPGQLEAALINLCANGRDAMPGGGLLQIQTSPVGLDRAYARENAEVAPGQYVMISVSDTGEGVPPEHLPRLFEPFFTTKGPGSGTGLGLSMVYGFVKQSGGHIKVYSEVGHGTVVRLYFPAVDRPASPGRSVDRSLPPSRVRRARAKSSCWSRTRRRSVSSRCAFSASSATR